MPTLEQAGTPWAEVYIGSGRFTGRLSDTGPMSEADQTRVWVGNMTQQEFDESFEWGVHDNFHTPTRPDFTCDFCQRAGWL